ncbi:TetR/AcrR family transcriptional regulator [Methylobacterium goesingense]|nr:TetR/AcrR family transcriptional regulator [Methylobacterium goesingense]
MRSAIKTSRGGRPTKDQSAELASRILDVASNLFATQGFAATSMEQVAAACGAGKDTVYRRYPTKSALFSALMARLHATLIPELDQAVSTDGTAMEKLRSYARVILDINLRPEFLALNRVALGEAMAFGAIKPIPTREDPVMERFAILVKNAQAAGHLVGDEAFFLADQLLYATSIKPLIAAMLGDDRYREMCAREEYFTAAWTFFLAGAAPRQVSLMPDPTGGEATANSRTEG